MHDETNRIYVWSSFRTESQRKISRYLGSVSKVFPLLHILYPFSMLRYAAFPGDWKDWWQREGDITQDAQKGVPDAGRSVGKNHPQAGAVSKPIPSGKHTKNYGKSPFLMGTSTINGHFQ